MSRRAVVRSAHAKRFKSKPGKHIARLMIFGILLYSLFFLSASFGQQFFAQPINCTEYRSVKVLPGDSLWSIAGTYSSGTGYDIRAYIREVKNINGMDSSLLKAGESLIIITSSGNVTTTAAR